MTKLEIAKKVIKENFEKGTAGIFNTRNVVGDKMDTIYDDGKLMIDICYYYSYFEVFGLSRKDFDKLDLYYDELWKEYHNEGDE